VAPLPPRKPGANDNRPAKPPHAESAPLTDRAVAVIFLGLAVLLVLGYLFVSKLMDISREEDCMLGNRRNCAAPDMELKR
jgi:hypothetical protein